MNAALVAALLEQGLSEEDAAETAIALQRLQLWHVPEPDPERMAQLVLRLQAATAGRSAHTSIGPSPGSQLFELLRIAQLQVQILRAEFWLSSAAVVCLGAAAIVVRPDAQRSLLAYLLGPLVGYCAVATAFSGAGMGLLECELACPPSARQLAVARVAVVLGYTTALGVFLSLLAGSAGAAELTLSWLAPLFVEVGATLLLSLRIPVTRAAAVVYGIWGTLLASAWGFWGPLGSPNAGLNVLLMGAGLCALSLAVYALPRRLDHQLGRAVV